MKRDLFLFLEYDVESNAFIMKFGICTVAV